MQQEHELEAAQLRSSLFFFWTIEDAVFITYEKGFVLVRLQICFKKKFISCSFVTACLLTIFTFVWLCVPLCWPIVLLNLTELYIIFSLARRIKNGGYDHTLQPQTIQISNNECTISDMCRLLGDDWLFIIGGNINLNWTQYSFKNFKLFHCDMVPLFEDFLRKIKS